MSGFLWEEEGTDYLGLVTGGLATGAGLLMDLPCTLIALLTTCGLVSYEFIMTYVLLLSELLALKEWWGAEHTVFLLWLSLCLPAYGKRSSWNCQDVILQLVSGLSDLMIFGSLVQMVNGLQGGVLFSGKLKMPTLAVIQVVTMQFGASFGTIKKEIYGYGVNDSPADEKCARVFDAIKKCVSLESIVFLTIATFGLPTLDLEAEDFTPWLCAFPIIALLREMNSYFDPAVEETIVAEVATDLNGTPPQPEAPQAEAAEAKEGVKEMVEKIEGEDKEKAETEKVSLITKLCEKINGVIGFVKNSVLTIVGKIKSIISCLLGHILALPWNCILSMVIRLGLFSAWGCSMWHLTEDFAILAFPMQRFVLPLLINKAKEKQWLTDNAGHLISEIGALVACSTHYYLYRTYIEQPI